MAATAGDEGTTREICIRINGTDNQLFFAHFIPTHTHSAYRGWLHSTRASRILQIHCIRLSAFQIVRHSIHLHGMECRRDSASHSIIVQCTRCTLEMTFHAANPLCMIPIVEAHHLAGAALPSLSLYPSLPLFLSPFRAFPFLSLYPSLPPSHSHTLISLVRQWYVDGYTPRSY